MRPASSARTTSASRNEYLPTVHGFDEFFGNLYHLNAEEDPESFTYPRDPKFRELLGPRGVLHTWATDKDDLTEQPRFGRIGRQRIEDTGAAHEKAHGDHRRRDLRRGDGFHGAAGEGRQAVLRLE